MFIIPRYKDCGTHQQCILHQLNKVKNNGKLGCVITDLQPEISEARRQASEELEKYKDAYLGRYLVSVEDVLDAHFLLADFFADSDDPMTYGVKNPHLLASALDRQTVGYGSKRK